MVTDSCYNFVVALVFVFASTLGAMSYHVAQASDSTQPDHEKERLNISIAGNDYGLMFSDQTLADKTKRLLADELQASLSMLKNTTFVSHKTIREEKGDIGRYDARLTHWMKFKREQEALPSSLKNYWGRRLGGFAKKDGKYSLIVSKKVISLFQEKRKIASRYESAMPKARELVAFLNDDRRRKDLPENFEKASDIFYGVGPNATRERVMEGAEVFATKFDDTKWRRPSIFDLEIVEEKRKLRVVAGPGRNKAGEAEVVRTDKPVRTLFFQTSVRSVKEPMKRTKDSETIEIWPTPEGLVFLDGDWRYLMVTIGG